MRLAARYRGKEVWPAPDKPTHFRRLNGKVTGQNLQFLDNCHIIIADIIYTYSAICIIWSNVI